MNTESETHAEWIREITGGTIGPTTGRLHRLARDYERLRSIVGKLPVTADGFPLTPGSKLWGPNPYHSSGEIVELMVTSIGILGSGEQRFRVIAGPMSMTKHVPPSACYSTREAAEAAIPKATGQETK